MRKLALYISVALLLAACIYPIDNTEELTGFEGVAIEGNILVGDISSFAMYPLQAIGNSEDERVIISASFTVEDDMGHSWAGSPAQEGWVSDFLDAGTAFVDLRDADPSRKYRLRAVNLETRETYVSSWVNVIPPCTIDSLVYVKDEEAGEMTVNLSVHGNNGEGYYRLAIREDWEYTADFNSMLEYIPNDRFSRVPGEMRYITGVTNYFCWQKHIDPKLNVFNTLALSSDKVTRPLMKITRRDDRISYIYCLTAGVMSISEDHYNYLEHLATVSDYNGSLFSPNPSEMRGNIRSETDSTHFVAGYIGAGTMVKKRVFYDNNKEFFYKRTINPADTLESIPRISWQAAFWERNMRPVLGSDLTEWMWAKKRCVDCRSKGGNKDKPYFWINNDQ